MIPSGWPACCNARVSRLSCSDGVTLPVGWLCATDDMRRLPPQRRLHHLARVNHRLRRRALLDPLHPVLQQLVMVVQIRHLENLVPQRPQPQPARNPPASRTLSSTDRPSTVCRKYNVAVSRMMRNATGATSPNARDRAAIPPTGASSTPRTLPNCFSNAFATGFTSRRGMHNVSSNSTTS